MQSTEKKSGDTRTFSEIYQSLNAYWRNELKSKMIYKMRISEVTFYNWTKGRTRPRNYSTQRDAAAVIKSVLKLDVHPGDLFNDTKSND